jgi:hypothetical protein
MSLLGVGSIIEAVGKVADDLITTDKERMEMEVEQRKLDLEEKRINQATDLAQIEVNKVEAASSSIFVSGWRPAIGWIGVAAMGYQFLLYPLFQWGMEIFAGYELDSCGAGAPSCTGRRPALGDTIRHIGHRWDEVF